VSLQFRDYKGSCCGCVYQADAKDEVLVPQGQGWRGPSSEGVFSSIMKKGWH
jgi:hypothetical protein